MSRMGVGMATRGAKRRYTSLASTGLRRVRAAACCTALRRTRHPSEPLLKVVEVREAARKV